MADVSTTKLFSNGQVLIPENIRKKLKLKAGAKFVVLGDGDVVILKKIAVTSPDDFDALVKKVRRGAKQAGLKKSDVEKAIKSVRSRK